MHYVCIIKIERPFISIFHVFVSKYEIKVKISRSITEKLYIFPSFNKLMSEVNKGKYIYSL